MPTQEQISIEGFHVGKPNIPLKDLLLKNFERVIDNKWLTNFGPLSLELEKRIAEYLNVKHCVLVSNGTVGLEILQRALGIKGEVIVPGFTFVATPHSVRYLGSDPVFCDVDIDSHLIKSDLVEDLITDKTTCILGVHLWGQACNVEQLEYISKKHNLKLIFDASHAFGCKSNNKYIGNFGDAEVFSLHATKLFSTGEGGAITTNNDEIALKIRRMQNFGIHSLDCVGEIGTNAKMSEFSAAYGLAALDFVDKVIETNKSNYLLYKSKFFDVREIKLLNYNNSNNYQYVVISVPKNKREKIYEELRLRKIFARRYFFPGCHRMEPYKSEERYNKLVLENTEKIAETCLVLPTGPNLNSKQINYISDVIIELILDN